MENLANQIWKNVVKDARPICNGIGDDTRHAEMVAEYIDRCKKVARTEWALNKLLELVE